MLSFFQLSAWAGAMWMGNKTTKELYEHAETESMFVFIAILSLGPGRFQPISVLNNLVHTLWARFLVQIYKLSISFVLFLSLTLNAPKNLFY